MKTLTIKNFQLLPIFDILGYPMTFQKGRIKNRFLSIISEKYQAVEKSRLEILNDLCEKDDKGLPVMESNTYKLNDKNQIKFNEEFIKLMNEDCVIDVLPSLEKDLPMIKQLFNESTVDLDDKKINQLDAVLTAMDAINSNEPKKSSDSKKSSKK